MKRLFCVVLALMLAGCTPAALEHSSSVTEPTPDSAASNTVCVETALTPAGSTNSMGYFSFYYNPVNQAVGTQLARWDFGDMTMHIACSAPGCNHIGETCEGRIGGNAFLVLEDAVYTLENGPDGETYTLCCRQADGTHPQTVGTGGQWIFIGADEEFLYGFCNDAFGRVSRTDGTEVFLAHGAQADFCDFGRVLGVWNNRFVAVNWDPAQTQPVRICLLGKDGSVTQTAQVDADRFSSRNCVLIADQVIYFDLLTGDVMAVNVDSGETQTVTGALRSCTALGEEHSFRLQAVNGRPIVWDRDIVDGYLMERVFLVNEEGTATELTQRQEWRDYDPALADTYYVYYAPSKEPAPVQMVAQWKDKLVIKRALQFYTYERDGAPALGSKDVYALMNAEDYLAGKETYQEFTISQ
ncbi:hypothetical protein [uncultured Ruthenibacterium sp.]|uniref:hypothetical protein n=1 Tax=uncultured Ruthenibacterium sp. TaxID=1905347 RepID=UPI00349EFA77